MRNQRPIVQISRPNELQRLRRHLDSVLPSLQALPGLIGITLNGGLSRGYADTLSEIDLTLYLDSPVYSEWQKGLAPITLGITPVNGVLYDIKVLDYDAEQARRWEAVELWDASYAQVLFDPQGRVADLLSVKLSDPPRQEQAEGSLFRCWWYYHLAGDIWIYRQDALQGHLMLHQALIALLEALFLVNGEYIPHEKWLIHMSRSLAWTPQDWEQSLRAAMSTSDMSVESLVARQSVLDALWHEVDACARARVCPDLPVAMMQRTFYRLLKTLAERGTLSIHEWREMASTEMLNHAPFHELVMRDGDLLRFDRERLSACRPDWFYRWQYEVVQAVAESVR